VRYYEQKKKLKKIKTKAPNYNLRDIIADNYLDPVLKRFLKNDTEYPMSGNMSAGVIKYGT